MTEQPNKCNCMGVVGALRQCGDTLYAHYSTLGDQAKGRGEES